MKNLSKKIISLIMALLILVTAIPTNIFANGINENSKEDSKVTTLQITEPEINPVYAYYLEHPEEFKYGYIPPKYILPFEESSVSRMQFRNSNLPSEFKTDLNYVTSVKNQWGTGTCWAHSAISTIETLIARQLPIDINSLNFSEGHMALNSGRDYDLNSGGNNYAAWRYFSTLAGPVSENNDIFKKYTIDQNFTGKGLEQMTDASNMHHEYYISEAKEYKNTTENIKSAVYNNYSVASGYYFDEKKSY